MPLDGMPLAHELAAVSSYKKNPTKPDLPASPRYKGNGSCLRIADGFRVLPCTTYSEGLAVLGQDLSRPSPLPC